MATTYTVVKGDTLWDLAKKFGTTVAALAKQNNISDPDYIVVGQKLTIDGNAAPTPANTTNRVAIKVFGLQSNTDRTVYAAWTWNKSYTLEYHVEWKYDTGDNLWFVGSDTTVKVKQSVYNAPANAKRVCFRVKPISGTHEVNGKETSYWTGSWSTIHTYSFSDNPPSTPPVPTVKIENLKLTATLENLDVGNATHIEFEILQNGSKVLTVGKAEIKNRAASYSRMVSDGSTYKVRCRAWRKTAVSGWSDYSSELKTQPKAVAAASLTCKATSETSVYVQWGNVSSANSYDLEYTTEKRYFNGSDQTNIITGIEFNHYEKTGLDSGEEYFFRVRSVNNEGHSAWSSIISVIIGEPPTAPTTWSSTTTAITGEDLTLYWVHNSEDGSSQTYAQLEIDVDGDVKTQTIKNTTDEDEKDKTSFYVIDTSKYVEGTTIKWRVRTSGITSTFGEWSIQRTVDIYASPTAEMSVTNSDGELFEVLDHFPFYVSVVPGPSTQAPISYHVSIAANESYETVDSIGNAKIVNKGELVYSKHYDINRVLDLQISADSVDFENNISYTIVCTVAMNSGLTATDSSTFTVAWTDLMYEPNAEIEYNPDTISTSIRPFCSDENGELIPDISLAVYRREFDGSFTLLADGLDNLANTYITDPHPSLDYARYRVVAITNSTGAVSYYDLPGYPIDCHAAIIQWDEAWTNFDTYGDDVLAEPTWSGSMLKLPYNIDVSDSNTMDVSLVKYVGRKRPVSYYGTQLGEKSTWNMVIPKSDKETLYAIRRLAIWTGDVYVREPSGSGYWANVKVSFNQKHLDTIIPVTLDITRVEGGV